MDGIRLVIAGAFVVVALFAPSRPADPRAWAVAEGTEGGQGGGSIDTPIDTPCKEQPWEGSTSACGCPTVDVHCSGDPHFANCTVWMDVTMCFLLGILPNSNAGTELPIDFVGMAPQCVLESGLPSGIDSFEDAAAWCVLNHEMQHACDGDESAASCSEANSYVTSYQCFADVAAELCPGGMPAAECAQIEAVRDREWGYAALEACLCAGADECEDCVQACIGAGATEADCVGYGYGTACPREIFAETSVMPH